MSEEAEPAKPKAPAATALYLAVLQFLFNLCWVVYAIYLPTLATGVGIAAGTVLLILMMDQAIFTIFDTATGIAADRMSRVIGRIGRWVAIVTLVSCAAFVALPFITGIGPAGQWLFLIATMVWTATEAPSPGIPTARIVFAVAMVILALGYQTHFTVNTAPMFRKFTNDIDWLMPIFWVGFNIAMFPATLLIKRWGAFGVMGVFGVLGALAIVAAELATALNFLMAAQFLAGAAWGCILMSGFTAAFATGENGNEGKMVGVLFSALSFATFLRIGVIYLGWHRDPQIAAVLKWAPVACWMVAGAMLLALVIAWARQRPATAAT